MIRPVKVNREPIREIEVHGHFDWLKLESEKVGHIVGIPKFRFFLDVLKGGNSPIGLCGIAKINRWFAHFSTAATTFPHPFVRNAP